jgi:O-antigen/teichoic acid export membrane protein
VSINKTNNTKQTFWVLLGSLSSFGFLILSSVLLSRYFNKYDYGIYKQVIYIYSTLLVVFTLGVPKAYSYFLPRVPVSQAKDLISKLNYVLICLGGSLSLLLFFGADMIALAMNNVNLTRPLQYFSLVPLFMLPTMGIEGILATFNQTKLLAFYDVSSRFVMLLCVALPVVFFEGDVNSAIIGFSVASFFSFVVALFLKNQPVRKVIKEETIITYKDIFNYTIPIMGASIWGIIISSSDQFFISRYFGNEVFADFANGSLEIPFVGMIVSATSIVLAPIFSRKVFENKADSDIDIIDLWMSVLSKTVKMIYPIVIFFFVFSDVIMIILYGNKYQTSGIYFQIKLVVNFFTLIAYGPLILAIGGHRFYFKVHMYGAIILILLETISVYSIKSPIAITVISVLCQIARIVIILYYISNYFKIKFLSLFPILLILNILIPSVVILYSLRYLLIYIIQLEDFILILTAGIVYILFFFLWTKYRNIDYLSIVKPLLNKIIK